MIQEKLNKTPEIKEGTENKKLNDENINNQEQAVEQTVTTDNTLETKKDDETVVPQQNENVQEIKKEERKYPEEVTNCLLWIYKISFILLRGSGRISEK